MIKDFDMGPKLGDLVDRVVASYNADRRTQHIERTYLPARAEIIQVTSHLLELLYPGFIGRQHLTGYNVAFHVGDLLPRIGESRTTSWSVTHATSCSIQIATMTLAVGTQPM